LFDNIFKDVNVSYDIEFAPCMFGNEIKLEMKLINNDKPLIGSTVFRTPIAEGYSIDLNILFDKGSYKLKQAYREKLEVIITLMKLNPSLEIIIEGHSDRLGTENVNLKLSKSRANEVKKFITSKNINEKRIKTIGYGSSRPLFEYAENSNENSFNRRIQIVVSKP
jgi:outer membrane protein OmpA-like peptidoglycan-associated protein